MKGIDVLREFQTGIVGILGFAGVIATLIVNAKIARDARRAVVNQERETLRTALIEELNVLRAAYVGNAENCGKHRKEPGGFFDVPLYGMTDIYDNMLGKIGLLSSAQAAAVIHAYMTHRQVGHAIVALLGGVPVPSTQGVRVSGDKAPLLKDLYERTIPDMEAALVALGRRPEDRGKQS